MKTKKFSLGNTVFCEPCTKDCSATEPFSGRIIAFKGDLYQVEDQEGDVWDMDEIEIQIEN